MAKKKSKLRRNIIILIVIVVILGGYTWIRQNTQNTLAQYAKSAIQSAEVKKSDLKVKITGNGVLEANKKYEITSNYIGEVKKKYVEVENMVKKDDNLLRIGDSYLKAPMAGTILRVSYEEGNYVLATDSAKYPAVVIADLSKLVFTLEVDELDINKIVLGMSVTVTADAVQDKEYIGTVSKIGQEGKNLNGITTYDVTVEIVDYEGLKIGMNVDASLIVESKEDVLTIPMQAIQKTGTEAYVYVKDESYQGAEPFFVTTPNSMSEVAGYKKQVVTIGSNNKDEIQILEGLTEGDSVYYLSASKSLTEYMLDQSASSGGFTIGM